MGCLNSKVPNDQNNDKEIIEIVEQQQQDRQSLKNPENSSSNESAKKDIKQGNNDHKNCIENETSNVLHTQNDSSSFHDEQKSLPVESPKSQRPQRESLDSSSEKKLKLSELLHAEKMKKTSGNISSSGEVRIRRLISSHFQIGKRRLVVSGERAHIP